MSDKVVGKIFVTSWKNYKKFRDNENNRNLDERHVASFRKNGWDIEPITVNKDYVIISGHHRLVAVITNNYTTGSVAKIKSDDFEFPLEEFIKVDEKLQILSDVLEPARNSKRSSAFLEKAALFMLDNGAVPSTLKDKLDKYSSTIQKMYFSSAYREYLDNRNKKAERT